MTVPVPIRVNVSICLVHTSVNATKAISMWTILLAKVL